TSALDQFAPQTPVENTALEWRRVPATITFEEDRCPAPLGDLAAFVNKNNFFNAERLAQPRELAFIELTRRRLVMKERIAGVGALLGDREAPNGIRRFGHQRSA